MSIRCRDLPLDLVRLLRTSAADVQDEARVMQLRTGDVLVSRITACVEHEVSIVPGPAEIVCPTHDAAVRAARELACQRQVDAWLTADHVHVLKIGSFRTEQEPAKR